MADKKRLFSVSLYDTGDGYKKDEEWKRYSDAYVIAGDLESAATIAEKNASENQVVAGLSERVGAKVFYE